jgi:hypothetical protein
VYEVLANLGQAADLGQAAPQEILVRVDLDSSAVQYKTTHQLAKPSQSEGCQKQSDKSLTPMQQKQYSLDKPHKTWLPNAR